MTHSNGRRHRPEELVAKLRQADEALAKDAPIAEVLKHALMPPRNADMVSFNCAETGCKSEAHNGIARDATRGFLRPVRDLSAAFLHRPPLRHKPLSKGDPIVPRAFLRLFAALASAALAALAPAHPAEAESDMKAAPAPIEVRVGIFLNAVPEVDLQANNFTFDAYVWFVWNPETWPPPSVGGTDEARKSPAETFEIVQSSGLESNVVFARDGYICMQLKGKRLSFWDVRDYPFDRQHLEIVIEDSSFDSTEVRYVPDIANSGVMPGLRVAGALTSAPQIVVAD